MNYNSPYPSLILREGTNLDSRFRGNDTEYRIVFSQLVKNRLISVKPECVYNLNARVIPREV